MKKNWSRKRYDAILEDINPTAEIVLIASMLVLYGALFIVIENKNKGKVL